MTTPNPTPDCTTRLRLLVGTKPEVLAAQRRAALALTDATEATGEALAALASIAHDNTELLARLDQIQAAEAKLTRIANDGE